jgi:hypothetical protein
LRASASSPTLSNESKPSRPAAEKKDKKAPVEKIDILQEQERIPVL